MACLRNASEVRFSRCQAENICSARDLPVVTESRHEAREIPQRSGLSEQALREKPRITFGMNPSCVSTARSHNCGQDECARPNAFMRRSSRLQEVFRAAPDRFMGRRVLINA